MPELKQHTADLIAAGQLEEALRFVKQEALRAFPDLDTPAILLLAELEYLRQNEINGILLPAEVIKHRQQLAARLLSLVDGAQAAPVSPASGGPKTTVLFLGANPFQHLALELEREVIEISEGLKYFGKRQEFDFRARMHATPADLQRMLLDAEFEPRFIHFAGNAVVQHPEYGTGIIFEDGHGKPRVITGKALAQVLGQFKGVECVFLNTCDSGPAALEVGQAIPYAIGMNTLVFDHSAIEFAVAFYEAIADGKDVPFAFTFAKNRLMLSHTPEQADVPVLIHNGHCNDPVYLDRQSHLDDPQPRLAR